MPILQVRLLETFLEYHKLVVESLWVSLPRLQMQPLAFQIQSMLLRQSQWELAAVFRVRQKRETQPRESPRLQFLDPTLVIFWISKLICLVVSPRRKWTILSLIPLLIRVSTSSHSHWARIPNSTSLHVIVPRVPKDPLIITKRHIVVELPQPSIQRWREAQVVRRVTGSLSSAVFQQKFCINKKLAGVIQTQLDTQKRFSKMLII